MQPARLAGISSDGVKEEFDEHAKEEQEHMRMVAERINQLGGAPDFNPENLRRGRHRSMWLGLIWSTLIKENLIAERITPASIIVS